MSRTLFHKSLNDLLRCWISNEPYSDDMFDKWSEEIWERELIDPESNTTAPLWSYLYEQFELLRQHL